MATQAGREADAYCRSCRAAYGEEHYAANRQRYIDRAGSSSGSWPSNEPASCSRSLMSSVHGLRRDGSRGLGIRPPAGQVVRYWARAPRPSVASDPRRNGEVRRGACELPPASHGPTTRHDSRCSQRAGSVPNRQAGDGTRTRSSSLEGSRATSDTSPAPIFEDTRAHSPFGTPRPRARVRRCA